MPFVTRSWSESSPRKSGNLSVKRFSPGSPAAEESARDYEYKRRSHHSSDSGGGGGPFSCQAWNALGNRCLQDQGRFPYPEATYSRKTAGLPRQRRIDSETKNSHRCYLSYLFDRICQHTSRRSLAQRTVYQGL